MIKTVRMGMHHIPDMARLEEACFSCPWSESMIRQELASPVACYWAAEDMGKLIGYAGMSVIVDEGHITNIAVAPAYRRNGVGRLLMDRLMETAKQRELALLTLEVRQSNTAAIALYTRFGFRQEGVRRKYYQKPIEDALLMTWRKPGEDKGGAR